MCGFAGFLVAGADARQAGAAAVLDLSLALLVVGWFVLPAPNDRRHWACCGTDRRPWRPRNDKR